MLRLVRFICGWKRGGGHEVVKEEEEKKETRARRTDVASPRRARAAPVVYLAIIISESARNAFFSLPGRALLLITRVVITQVFRCRRVSGWLIKHTYTHTPTVSAAAGDQSLTGHGVTSWMPHVFLLIFPNYRFLLFYPFCSRRLNIRIGYGPSRPNDERKKLQERRHVYVHAPREWWIKEVLPTACGAPMCQFSRVGGGGPNLYQVSKHE